MLFQCSSASRKFLNVSYHIPLTEAEAGFSALQRAENSSNPLLPLVAVTSSRVSVLFSEPKIPQTAAVATVGTAAPCFSALQRAENSSIVRPAAAADRTGEFQCSSASRKFLNPSTSIDTPVPTEFQCSSASRKFLNSAARFERLNRCRRVSVLFSEPKIPQSNRSRFPS